MWELVHLQHARPRELDAPVNAIAMSRDGVIAAGGDDGKVRVWRGDEVPRALHALDGVHTVAFSADGKRLAGAGAERSVYVWEVATNKLLAKLAVPVPVREVVFDGDAIVTVGTDGVVRRDGRLAAPTDARVASIAVHDGVAVGATAGGVLVWSLAAPDAAVSVHSVAATTVAFAPDGEHVVVAGQGFAHVYFRAGTHLAEPPLSLEGPTGNVVSIALSHDGSRIYTASDDGATKIWDAAKGKLLGVRYVPGAATALVLSPDDTELAVASTHDKQLGAVTTWDVHVAHTPPAEFAAFVADYVPYELDDNDVVRLSGREDQWEALIRPRRAWASSTPTARAARRTCSSSRTTRRRSSTCRAAARS